LKFYCHAFPAALRRIERRHGSLRAIIDRIAAGTDTGDLVVSLFLVSRSRWHGGAAYARQWSAPEDYWARRGKWRRAAPQNPPADLPARFKLIRLALPATPDMYPLKEQDVYGWQHVYDSFASHLAFLFAHELHHFRRFHLGLHGREGEQAANAWAVARARTCGFAVSSVKGAVRRRHRPVLKPTILQLLNPLDFCGSPDAAQWREHFALAVRLLPAGVKKKYVDEKLIHIDRLRGVRAGDMVWIQWDPSHRYQHQAAQVVRPMRRNSLRLVIRTQDGRDWRWPMVWLSLEKPARAEK